MAGDESDVVHSSWVVRIGFVILVSSFGLPRYYRRHMVIIRPVSMNDLDQLEELAGLAGVGLTTLPRDRKFLRKRIRASQIGFENLIEHPEGPAGRSISL